MGLFRATLEANNEKLKLAKIRNKLIEQACEHVGALITVRTVWAGNDKGHDGIYIDGKKSYTVEPGNIEGLNKHLHFLATY